MSICVVVDGTGAVVEAVGETAPACSEFMLTTAAHLDRLTYWADLAIQLDPSGANFWVLVSAMIAAAGGVLGLRVVVTTLRALWREA